MIVKLIIDKNEPNFAHMFQSLPGKEIYTETGGYVEMELADGQDLMANCHNPTEFWVMETTESGARNKVKTFEHIERVEVLTDAGFLLFGETFE